LLLGIPADKLGVLLGAWDGGCMDGTLQLSDLEGDGESVAESVSGPGTDGSIAKSLGLMRGCTTRLLRLRQGVPLMIGVAVAAETREDEL